MYVKTFQTDFSMFTIFNYNLNFNIQNFKLITKKYEYLKEIIKVTE